MKLLIQMEVFQMLYLSLIVLSIVHCYTLWLFTPLVFYELDNEKILNIIGDIE